MSRTARSEAELRRVRELILDAAARVFAQHGVSRVKLDQIATEAGYSTASLYNYFSGREAVILALVDRSIERIQAAVREPMPTSLSPEQRIESILLRLLVIARDQLWLTETLLNRGLVQEAAGEVGERYLHMLAGFLHALESEVARVEGVPHHQAARLTHHLVGLVRTESFAWLELGQPTDLAQLAADLMTFWLAGARALTRARTSSVEDPALPDPTRRTPTP